MTRTASDLRKALPDDDDLRTLADTFSVLGHESRLKIVAALSHREARVNELARAVGMSLSAVSHQLSKLRDLRVVRPRRDGRTIWYSLDDQHVADLLSLALQHISHR